MIFKLSKSVLTSALLAPVGVRSRSAALAEDPPRAPVHGAVGPGGDAQPYAEADRGSERTLSSQPCLNVAGTEANLTHHFCFEGCDAFSTPSPEGDIRYRIPNLANSTSNDKFKDDYVEYNWKDGWVRCGPEGLFVVGQGWESEPRIVMEQAEPGEMMFPRGAITVAMVLKHDVNTGNVPREYLQSWRFAFNSEEFPNLRVEVYGADTNRNRWLLYDNFYSTSEFVTVVATVNDTSFITYRNGVALAASSEFRSEEHQDVAAGPVDEPLQRLGHNGFKGTIKSVAHWTRALSAAEVAGLLTPSTVTPTPTAAPTSATQPTIENAGKGCWAHCGKTAGDCGYCGSGQCCRAVDYRNQVPGCEKAEGAQGARCGDYKGGRFPALMNVGLPCIGWCGKQPGDCDYCGIAGQCCRPFDGERCVPGCELASTDSWMMPGSQCGQFKDPSAAPVHCTAPTPPPPTTPGPKA